MEKRLLLENIINSLWGYDMVWYDMMKSILYWHMPKTLLCCKIPYKIAQGTYSYFAHIRYTLSFKKVKIVSVFVRPTLVHIP